MAGALDHQARLNSPLPHPSLHGLIGAVAGFFVMFVLWDLLVPLRCPACGGKLSKVYGEGRHVIFRCSDCGINH
jgi:hypothetical protein